MTKGTLFEITLNEEAALVLLRCLDCGESSVSKAEHDSGVAHTIGANVTLLRKQLASKLADVRLRELSSVR